MADHARAAAVHRDGMRSGFKMVRGMRRQLDEKEQFLIAQKVAEQLRRSNWNVQQGPPAPAHTADTSYKPHSTSDHFKSGPTS